MSIKYMCDLKLQTLRIRYLFQSTGRPISHRNVWPFRVFMIPLRDFIPEWNVCPGTITGVNSRRGDSRRHDILWWYHVNKCRATRGNRSELAPGRKSPPPVSCKHPLKHWISIYRYWSINMYALSTGYMQKVLSVFESLPVIIPQSWCILWPYPDPKCMFSFIAYRRYRFVWRTFVDKNNWKYKTIWSSKIRLSMSKSRHMNLKSQWMQSK